jgi:hypothetical protein
MLTERDRKVLEIISKQHLITKIELARSMGKDEYDGASLNVNRLMEMGYVDEVQSLGTCLVITQKGMREITGEE